MPPILRIPGEITATLRGPIEDMGYEYTAIDDKELNLRPGSELHERIKKNVLNRAQDSLDKMKARHDAWRRVDENLTAYIPADEAELVIKGEDSRKPISIVVPYSFATLETLLTYLVSAFLESPYFRYEGVTDEDTVGAIMLEKVVEMQSIRFKSALSLHTQFRDSLVYGFGATNIIWDSKHSFRTIRGPDNVVERREELTYEGNRINNIDPYLYLPDPSVAIHDPQRGEFVGWLDRTNYMSLLQAEYNNASMFNVKYLKGQDGRTTLLMSADGRGTKGGITGRDWSILGSIKPVDVVYMYITIIPNDEEWQLSDREEPQKWLFAVAADSVVIMAQPLDLDHDMFPTTICVPDYDGYSVSPISRIELVYGLQGVLDFMFNSHVANVRKAINDMLIVDPYMINMSDLSQPGPGKIIRTRRAIWGRGVKDGVQQLVINDITRGHMQDVMQVVIPLMQGTSSAVDSLMGIMRKSGERRSATEARDTRMSALSRLAKAAKLASVMAVYDTGYMHASHTQQFMNQDLYVSTMGRHQEMLERIYNGQRGVKVSPQDLNINYDVMIHDGSVELGEHADSWVQLYQILAGNPEIGQGFEMVKVFKHIARLLGAKNVDDFVRKGGGAEVHTAQDDVVRAEAAAGNIVPVEQAAAMRGGE